MLVVLPTVRVKGRENVSGISVTTASSGSPDVEKAKRGERKEWHNGAMGARREGERSIEKRREEKKRKHHERKIKYISRNLPF